jgi:hypothetical protein
MIKKCPNDNLEFHGDRRFCSKCGAALVDGLELATLMMPKPKTGRAEYIEVDDDLTFRLSIRDQSYKLSMDEIRILAAEACAVVRTAERLRVRPEN